LRLAENTRKRRRAIAIAVAVGVVVAGLAFLVLRHWS
jgi:hypothetical protein